MYYILFDYDEPKDSSASFIAKGLDEEAVDVYSPHSQFGSLGRWIKGCIRVLRLSNQYDTIIVWFDFQAVMLWWICTLTLRRRNIACLNLMLKNKSSIKNKIVTRLYKIALKQHNFKASVTSVEYGNSLATRLKVNNDFVLIHDVFHENYKIRSRVNVKANSLFCGGRNGRDWRFIMDVAKSMSDVDFYFVMPDEVYYSIKDSFTKNIHVKHNVSIEEFIKIMCESSIVALPLETEAPAGLIVIFQAAANLKYIITTDTITTREYLSDQKGCLLPNNVETWCKAIREKLSDVGNNQISSERLLQFMRNNCSEHSFIAGIEVLCRKLKQQ